MRRVLRITFFLGGGLLLLLTAGMALGRHEKSAPELMLAAVKENNMERLYLHSPELNYWRPLTPAYYFISQNGWHPNQQWFYVLGNYLDSAGERVDTDLWQVKAGGLIASYFSAAEFPLALTWTPDGEWLLYGERDAHGDGDIYKVRANGRDSQNLTADFAPSVVLQTEGPPIQVSPDGQSIAFAAFIDDTYQPHWMPLAGGTSTPQNLEMEITLGPAPIWMADNKAMLIHSGDSGYRLYRWQADGSGAQPLTDDVEVQETLLWHSNEQNLMVINQWWPAGDVKLIALNLNDGQRRWVTDGFGVAVVGATQQWLIIWHYGESALYRVWLADGRPEIIAGLSYGEVVAVALDARSLLYITWFDSSVELYRIEVETGDVTPLYASRESLSFVGWSSDGAQVLINENGPSGEVQFWLNRNGTIVKSQMPLLRWLRWLPSVELAWSPVFAFIMGLGLLGIGFLGKGKLRTQIGRVRFGRN